MLNQWSIPDPPERQDVNGRLKSILDNNSAFVPKIIDLCKSNRGLVENLKTILSADTELWPRLKKFF
jgi:hypothetical protein